MPNYVDRLVIGIAFILLAFLNKLEFIKLPDIAIFAFSLATLLFSISSLFNGKSALAFYILGLFSMLILPWVINTGIIKTLTDLFDSNTILLLGIAFAILTLYISDYKIRVLDLQKNRAVQDKEIEIYEQLNKKLKETKTPK